MKGLFSLREKKINVVNIFFSVIILLQVSCSLIELNGIEVYQVHKFYYKETESAKAKTLSNIIIY